MTVSKDDCEYNNNNDVMFYNYLPDHEIKVEDDDTFIMCFINIFT